MAAATRILIVDDHPVVLFGLRVLFADDPRCVVVGEATERAVALDLVAREAPDVIVLDLVLGGRDGIHLMRELLAIRPSMGVVVYSSQEERLFAPRVIQAGGKGYVAKSEALTTVGRAVEAVAEGRLFLSPSLKEWMLRTGSHRRLAEEPYGGLSNRELQVFRLIGEGRSVQEISDALHLSAKTVGTYRERLKIKLHLNSARDLERAAFGHTMPSRGP